MDSTMKNITFILAAFAVSFLIAPLVYLGLLNIRIAVCKICLGILLLTRKLMRIRKLFLKAGTSFLAKTKRGPRNIPLLGCSGGLFSADWLLWRWVAYTAFSSPSVAVPPSSRGWGSLPSGWASQGPTPLSSTSIDRHIQHLLNQPQHELPLQVRLDPQEEVLRNLEGHRASSVCCHDLLTSVFFHFVVFEQQVGDVFCGGQVRLFFGLGNFAVQVDVDLRTEVLFLPWWSLSFRLIVTQVYPKGYDKAITKTTKEPQTDQA